MTTMVGLYVEYKAKTQEIDAALGRLDRELEKVKNSQNQVGTSFDKMHGKMSKGIGQVTSLWGTALKTFAGGFTISYFANIAEGIDQISKSAGTMGTSVEAFQRLKYVGDLAGVSMGELEVSMRKMSMTIGQGLRGMKNAVDSFDALGISAQQLKGMSIDKQYEAIADAIGNIQDKNVQASISMEIFGGNYSSVLKMIRQGVGETGKEFEALGLGISDDAGKMVEDFNDSITKIKAIWESGMQFLVIKISPVFLMINEQLQRIIKAFRGVGFSIQGLTSAAGALIPTKPFGQDTGDGGATKTVSGYDVRLRQMLAQQGIKNVNSNASTLQLTELLASKFAPESVLPSIDALMKGFDKLKTSNDKLADSATKTANKINEAGQKMGSFFTDMIKSAGQSKLTQVLGTDSSGQPNDVVNEKWDQLIKDIYNSALTGKKFVDRSNLTGANELTAQQGLNLLQDRVTSFGSSGDISGIKGYIGAIGELKDFLKKINPENNKVKLDIEVKAEEGFVLKIAQSAELKKQYEKILLDVANLAARQMRGS